MREHDSDCHHRLNSPLVPTCRHAASKVAPVNRWTVPPNCDLIGLPTVASPEMKLRKTRLMMAEARKAALIVNDDGSVNNNDADEWVRTREQTREAADDEGNTSDRNREETKEGNAADLSSVSDDDADELVRTREHTREAADVEGNPVLTGTQETSGKKEMSEADEEKEKNKQNEKCNTNDRDEYNKDHEELCTKIAHVYISEAKNPDEKEVQLNKKMIEIMRKRNIVRRKDHKKEIRTRTEKKRKNTGDKRRPLNVEPITSQRIKKRKIDSPKSLLCEKFKRLALKDTG